MFVLMLSHSNTNTGGCELSTTTRVKTAWKKFKDLVPVLSSRHLSFKTRGRVYSSCVRSAMLHASETWPLTKRNLQRLQQNDRAMVRQICNVRPQVGVVGWCEGAVYLTSPGRPTDIGLQLGKACYPCSG